MSIPRIVMTIALALACAMPAIAQERDEVVPYSADSPWNLPIGPTPEYDPNSEVFTQALSGVFGIDPTRFTMPVYVVSADTPRRSIRLSGVYSEVSRDGRMLIKRKGEPVSVPLPSDAEPAAGSDAQIIVWNPDTGEEWGFWRVKRNGEDYEAVNGYSYNTNWNGVCPFGFLSRGAGTPYLVGLVRRFEIERGRIAHAIALGVNYPSRLYVYPATKSDGKGLPPSLPSGARLQLDPTLTDADFERWGLDEPGKIIARALQEFGMIVIDSSGHPKLYAEYEGTAHWNGLVHKDTVRAIPYSAFRVLKLSAPSSPPPPTNLAATTDATSVSLTWDSSVSATRYRILRRAPGDRDYTPLDEWVTNTSYTDSTVHHGLKYAYVVQAMSHNGASRTSRRVRVIVGEGADAP